MSARPTTPNKALPVTKSSPDKIMRHEVDYSTGVPRDDIQRLSVPLEFAGERIDKLLLHFFPQLSRSRLQAWIKDGQVKIDGEAILKPKYKVMAGDSLEVETTLAEQGEWVARDIPLVIHYQDEAIIVINKPVGLVVHPAPGHYEDTLVNGLLYRFPELGKLPRAGIIHRLDKDTTGLLVVARTGEAHHALVEQLQRREFVREYQALVHGLIVAGDTIDLPIARHPTNRKKMAVAEYGKEAITHFRIGHKYANFTLLDVKLETGRTHQIRVHLAHLKHSLVGDRTYGVHNLQPKAMTDEFGRIYHAFKRQALHAGSLGLNHPQSGEWMQWQVELPADFRQLLDAIAEFEASKV